MGAACGRRPDFPGGFRIPGRPGETSVKGQVELQQSLKGRDELVPYDIIVQGVEQENNKPKGTNQQ